MSDLKNQVNEPTSMYKTAQFITDINSLDFNKQYSYADYLRWKFTERVELIKGWIYTMSPAPKRIHQKIVGNLHLNFRLSLRKKTCPVYIAPFDVRLIKNKGTNTEITTVIQPDICIICDENKLDDYGCIGAPDLIVEVLSLSTSKKDYGVKFDLYQENKIKEYWIVNPELNTVEVYTLQQGVYKLHCEFTETNTVTEVTSILFPKLRLKLRDIFD